MEDACRRGDFEKVKEVLSQRARSPNPHLDPVMLRPAAASFLPGSVHAIHEHGQWWCAREELAHGLGAFVRRGRNGWLLAPFVFSVPFLPRFPHPPSLLSPLIVGQEPWRGGVLPA